MLITRTIQKFIENSLFQQKIIVIYGARQVGKTTLIKMLQDKYNDKSQIYLNCDEPDIRTALTNVTSTQLKARFGNARMVFIDEAQRVPNIGLTLKLAVDNMADKQFIVTGSSSFDLANKINEPLTGRKFEFFLYPFSLAELSAIYNGVEMDRLIGRFLSYGSFPGIISAPDKAELSVLNLVRGTLYKDVLAHKQLKQAELLEKLLQALAFQIGNQVSYNELAKLLDSTKETIEYYVRLLEQSFVIFRLRPFSRNLRNELKKTRKIYFYDLGVRNALINAFGPVELRSDIGALWENFLMVERMKYLDNGQTSVNRYFWRTHAGREIDLLEEKDLMLNAFEFKWGSAKKPRAPKAFADAYPDARFETIGRSNFHNFIGL